MSQHLKSHFLKQNKSKTIFYSHSLQIYKKTVFNSSPLACISKCHCSHNSNIIASFPSNNCIILQYKNVKNTTKKQSKEEEKLTIKSVAVVIIILVRVYGKQWMYAHINAIDFQEKHLKFVEWEEKCEKKIIAQHFFGNFYFHSPFFS